jgi:hypothetical protein
MVGVSIVIARHPEWNEGIAQILRQAQNERREEPGFFDRLRMSGRKSPDSSTGSE